MNTNHLKQEWIDLSTPWIKKSREERNPTRTGLLDKPMLEACGDVEGLRALDCGCGEGRFCRMLAERGVASVLGLDLCEPMIEAANQLASGRDEYRVADVQEMSFLGDESFDLVVSYLNQCDLPDYEANNREVYRLLKPGGRFIVANLHPMRSAVGAWHRSPDGTKEHVIVDKYFDEGERQWVMLGVRFTNFHRSLERYVRSYLNAGFRIESIVEPTITEEELKLYPELDDEMRVPNFIIFALRKEEGRG
ncbi:MAG: class I SAM-dependent methyltransferase [Ignavibacteriae bacterium]|nr:class I SAM-dependent methyltransferase [Ignavibacteriota bacterium]MCB9214556.1 class I SAM-dependent methyltransferase [Ignavibacteria bacterium]